MNRLPREQGYTLIELMIAFAIAGTLIGIAVPSVSSWVQNSRIDAATQSLSTGIMLARNEAITRNQDIHVSTFDDNIFHICVAPTKTKTCDPSLEDDYIGNVALSEDVLLDGDKSTEDGLIFSTRGRLTELPRSALYTICDSRGDEHGMRFQINQVGRVLLRPIDTAAGESCKLT